MKILVTGSNGLLGQKVSRLLEVQPNVSPVFTARKNLTYPVKKGVFSILDIADEAQVNRVIEEIKPDVIIHTAAMTQVDDCELNQKECWRQNVLATQYLIAAAGQVGAFFIHVSTDFIFNGSAGPLDEHAIPTPVNYYGQSKLAAEEAVKNSKLRWAILRTVLVYGVAHDMSRSNIVLWVKKSLEDGKTIKVVDDQWRTPTLAEDLAMGCWLTAQMQATGLFNISGEEMMTPYDIATRTARFFKLDESLITKTDSTQFKQPAARPLRTGFIITKAKKELGYQPHSFEAGLELIQQQIKDQSR
jgi:dTDP-4-dehydrorhamnose reductase